MKINTRTGYMCTTDFRHEVGEASGVKIEPSPDLIPCGDECGVVKVEIKIIEIVKKSKI